MKRINSYAELKAAVEEYKPLLNLRKEDGVSEIPKKSLHFLSILKAMLIFL